MKIQRLKNGQHFITIPRQLIRSKGWSKGMVLGFFINNKGELVHMEKDKSLYENVKL